MLNYYKNKFNNIMSSYIDDKKSIYDFIEELYNNNNRSAKLSKFYEFIENNIAGKVFHDNVSRYKEYSSIKGKVTHRKMILKYGNELGESYWNSYREKQAAVNSFEYKQEKFGMSLEDFNNYNRSRSVTLKNLINRHGEDVGKEKFYSYCKKQSYVGCKLGYFIEKYGEEKGREIYENVNIAKSHSFESYIRKYGEDEGPIEFKKYNERMARSTSITRFSESSQKFFRELAKMLSNEFSSENLKFATNNGEWFIYSNEHKRVFLYDFCIPSIKFMIEYNGDLYHANPNKYSYADVPKFYDNTKTAFEIWEFDKAKNKVAENNGFEVVVIWENEATNNTQELITNLMDRINERTKSYKNQ